MKNNKRKLKRFVQAVVTLEGTCKIISANSLDELAILTKKEMMNHDK